MSDRRTARPRPTKRSTASTARLGAGALLVVVLGLLAGCADGGDGEGPSVTPTRTPTRTPTDSLSPSLPSPTRTPTATVPSPTRTPSATPPEPTTPPPATETPSGTAEPRSTAEPTTPEPTTPEPTTPEPTTPEPTTPEPSPTSEPTAEASEETPAEASDEQAADDEGVPPWVWWVAAALVLGCVVAVPLVVRARRRAAWRQRLQRQEAEVEWFARDLLRELRAAGSHQEMAGGWAVSRARVTAAEDELTVLESTAPDEAGRDRAQSLREASRHARDRMQQLVAPGPHDTWALDLDTIILELEEALRPAVSPPTPPPTPPRA